jgi:uncharacterized membrane-anchored protein
MSFVDHPLRARVVSEMHMRRMPSLTPPMTMIQIVRLVAPDERAGERQHVLAMPGVTPDAITEGSRHIDGQRCDGAEFIWECHSEASTMTLIMPAAIDDAFGVAMTDTAAMRWLSDAPGAVLRAVRIAIVRNVHAAAYIGAAAFTASELVRARIGPVQIWSDFLVRDDHFGRLLIASDDLPSADLGRTVQQLQELGNYRNLALLGLPLAQEQAADVTQLEQALVVIAQRMEAGSADPQLLDELCGVAAQLTRITAATAYRMSATAAYARIVEERLDALASQRIAGFQSLEEFTQRRLLPATRTCASFSARLETLSVRVERATSLLRTRVEMVVQAQNAALLSSMDKNAERQLRLQRVVEGLSVVAVSYYAVGLLAYILHAVAEPLRIADERLIAASVIPVVALVWVMLRRKVHAIVGTDH